jgi:hypothetical protein
MIIEWERDKGILTCQDGEKFKVTSIVRNELDGSRALHSKAQVIMHTPGPDGGPRYPYMPRPFPKGEWHITKIYETDNENYKPVIIETDAHQSLPVWALDSKGGYDHETDKLVDDWGYWLHHAWVLARGVWVASRTTHGCGNIIKEEDAPTLKDLLMVGDTLHVF